MVLVMHLCSEEEISAEEALHDIFLRCLSFAKERKIHLDMTGLDLALLSIESIEHDFPHIKVKGHDCKMWLFFLDHEFQKLPAQFRTEHCCVHALAQFLRVLEEEGTSLGSCFLKPSQAEAATRWGTIHLKLYGSLASKALEQLKPLYFLRPKIHQFHHKIVHRLQQGNLLNPRVVSEPEPWSRLHI